MVKIIERVIKKVDPLKDAVLIEGLPGIGYVGRIAAEHLIQEFQGEKVMEIYCDDFPPQVSVNDDGTIECMNNEIYIIREPINMVVVTGNSQALSPVGQYKLSKRLVEIGIRYGARITYTLGGFGIGHIKEDPLVYVAATSKELADKIKAHGAFFRVDGGNIVGAAGLMLVFSKLMNIEGACLMGETPGYIIDPKSAGKVLEVLSKVLNIEMDMKKLEKRAKDMEVFLERIKGFGKHLERGHFIVKEKDKRQRDDDLRYIG